MYVTFRRSIEAIHGYEDKVRIVLNKADQVDHQELMRVYGALMWSIAKVILTPRALRDLFITYNFRENFSNYVSLLFQGSQCA